MASNTIRGPAGTSIYNRLNSKLKNSPVFTELVRAVDKILDGLVHEPRLDLTTIRDPRRFHRGDWINLRDGRRAIINHIELDSTGQATVSVQLKNSNDTAEIILVSNVKDRDIILRNVQQHGFTYYSDSLTTADYVKINDWLEYYWQQSGTQNYVNFIGFIKNIRLKSDVLWTTDVGMDVSDDYPFLEPNYGHFNPVWQGGHDYPSSHVQLSYNRLDYPNFDATDVVRMFYIFAPINLVLERLAHDIFAQEIKLFTEGTAFLVNHEGGFLPQEASTSALAQIDYIVQPGGFAVHEGGRLHLTSSDLIDLSIT